jgi:hypothetical protein
MAVLAFVSCKTNIRNGQNTRLEEGKQSETSPVPCDLNRYQALSETHFVQQTLITLGKPTYPAEALRDSVEGLVNVEIVVDAIGTVVAAFALNGPILLRKAAAAGALACKFKRNFGFPTPGQIPYRRATLPYLFVLSTTKKVDDVHCIVVRPSD